MFVIVPEAVTEAVLAASNVAETDYTAWSAATAYAVGARVILTSGYHAIFECVSAHTNRHPVTDPAAASYWLRVGATNRWRAFDGKISDPVQRAGSITYTLAPTKLTNALAFFGLSASTVTVDVKSGSTVLTTSTVDLIDRTAAVDWFSWFFDDIVYSPVALVLDINASLGNTLDITISGSGTVEVGEIVMGRNRQIGTAGLGMSIGIKDYSRKDRDAFGNPIIVQRSFIDLADFKFTFPAGDGRRIKSLLASLRSTACVYHVGANTEQFGTTVFGFFSSFDLPLTDLSMSFGSLQIEGLT